MPILSTKKSNMTASLTLIQLFTESEAPWLVPWWSGWSLQILTKISWLIQKPTGWYEYKYQNSLHSHHVCTQRLPRVVPWWLCWCPGLSTSLGLGAHWHHWGTAPPPMRPAVRLLCQPQPPLKVPTPCLLCTSLPIHPTKNLIFLYLNSCNTPLQQLL